MTDVGGATNTYEAQSRNMINICTKYGFDRLIISCSYREHRRHTTDNGQRQGYDVSSPQVSYNTVFQYIHYPASPCDW